MIKKVVKSGGTFLFGMFFVTQLQGADDWKQWRGPSRDGKVAGKEWPSALTKDNLKQLWRVPMGKSYSGPIVADGVVFSTESVDDENEGVRAFDLTTGQPKWKESWEGSMRVPFFARKNGSWIRSTPATDGEHVYVAGMKDLLVCLNAKTGKKVWSFDFPSQLSVDPPAFGFVCSPLISGDSLYVQAGASTVRLNKKTGKIEWRSLDDGGGMNGSAFSSPVLAKIGGQEQLLVQTRTELCGVEPGTGSVLWRQEVPAFRGMNIITPVVHNDSLFTSTYGGKTSSYKLSKDSGSWKSSTTWELKMQGYMSTPLIINGHAYMHLRNKKFACVNLKTGKAAWETDKSFGDYWSLIAQGDRILALDEDGTLRLIRANPEKYDLISERKVAKKDTWAHIAVSGNKVIVRELEALTVFQWKD